MPLYRHFRLCAIALTATGAATAHAESPVSAIEYIRQNLNYRHAVESVAQKYESSLRTQCPKVQFDWNSASAHVARQPTMDAQDHIQQGVWVETLPGEACGQQRRYNAAVVFQDGEPSVLPLFPGKTDASPLLQQDTVTYVASALSAKGVAVVDCQIDVLETQLRGDYPSPGTPWHERWRVDVCGKQYWATVSYIPDATGTSISTSPKDIAAVN